MGAVCLGFLSGLFVAAALEVGLRNHFLEEQSATPWGAFFWNEHWALRTAASCTATVVTGFMAGIVARKHGKVLAIIASSPVALSWVFMAICCWKGQVLFLREPVEIQVTIANKLVASFIAITILPLAGWAGTFGEKQGADLGAHFDSRRFSLLGIKWYHYLWLPLLVYAWLIQGSWAVYYWMIWMAKSWDTGLSLVSFVGGFFSLFIFGTIYLMFNGAQRAYLILSGIESVPSLKDRTLSVLKFGLGWFVLAAILQTAIGLLELGLAKLFR